jgi:hypothetical protein
MSGSRTRRGSVPGDVNHTLEGEPELATENPLDGVALLLQQALGPVLARLDEQNAAQEELRAGLAQEKAAREAVKVSEVAAVAKATPPPYEEPGGANPEPEPAPVEAELLHSRNLSVEQIADQLFAKFALQQEDASRAAAAVASRILDTVPYQKVDVSKIEYPQRVFNEQEAGLLVKTDLLSSDEFSDVIPGYLLLGIGARAELEYALVVTRRLNDVLAHFDAGLRGDVEIDVRRSREVLAESRDLLLERVEGVKERAYVKKDCPVGESDETVVAKMDKKRNERMRPKRSGAFAMSATEQQEVDRAYAKKVAQHKANLLFNASRLGSTGGGAGGGGDGGGHKRGGKKKGAGADKPAAGD